jgi:hypothetical protein
MKKLAAIVTVLLAVSAVAFAADITPVKVSLFPKITVPAAETVHGLDLGLIATKVDEVQGVQLAWIYGAVQKKMVGVQFAFYSEADTKFVGLQSGFIVVDKEAKGLTYGFVNEADSFTGLQLGFVNIANKMKGIQLGVVNIIKTGPVPAMVFVNANF